MKNKKLNGIGSLYIPPKKQKSLKNRSLIDEGLDAIHDLDTIKKYIDDRLTELREEVSTYTSDVYDETVIARLDELTKLKYKINNLI